MYKDYQTLKDQLSRKVKKANPYGQYGFLRNPFPRAGETTAEPSYNQDIAKKAFEAKFVSFIQNDGESSDRFLVYGDQRLGCIWCCRFWGCVAGRLGEQTYPCLLSLTGGQHQTVRWVKPLKHRARSLLGP